MLGCWISCCNGTGRDFFPLIGSPQLAAQQSENGRAVVKEQEGSAESAGKVAHSPAVVCTRKLTERYTDVIPRGVAGRKTADAAVDNFSNAEWCGCGTPRVSAHAVLHRHTHMFTSVEFSPDGNESRIGKP